MEASKIDRILEICRKSIYYELVSCDHLIFQDGLPTAIPVHDVVLIVGRHLEVAAKNLKGGEGD